MSKILACTDGSVYALSTYDHAAWAAQKMEASVDVLHVLDQHREAPAVSDLSGNLGFDASAELMQQIADVEEAKGKLAIEKAKVILADAKKRFTEDGIENVNVIQRHGSLVATVEEYEKGADLVVIGKRGEAADFDTMHLGANLERVIRASKIPVLVAARKFEPVEKFLIAFDGGPSAEKAIEFVVNNPLLQGLECHLLTVGRDKPSADAKLAAARERLSAAGFKVTAEIVDGDADEVISREVKQRNIDLLVMGAYGHSKIRQLFVGSTTTAMVRTCCVPVLMFR
ncbi:universal stress protein [Sulfuriroseicoccus oceanibius]|uniref:Universal stress protein n=1 Tax=Sulfuriroseicoccus oceanibius TaxID=2707525 RepID=A0A6B3L916_9BACT|nr:universal stress protein [Sulfuriroseicoccus oceanibius]QQL44120.1 universal stress protein [Sulfuriroseicoccus oceanibius]